MRHEQKRCLTGLKTRPWASWEAAWHTQGEAQIMYAGGDGGGRFSLAMANGSQETKK